MPAPPAQLRRARPSDAAGFARLMSEPAVFRHLLQFSRASEEQWRERLERPAGPDHLHPVDRLRRPHAAMLGSSVDPAAQGQGMGTALMQGLCDHADRWAQLPRQELTVFTGKARAVALYRRFGFVREGVHRAYALRDGVCADTLAMARLHPDPPRLPGKAT
jgi:putative acetyltransferase